MGKHKEKKPKAQKRKKVAKQTILFASPEAHPLVKTGGLGDVCGALPNALKGLGHKVKLILPAYDVVKERVHDIEVAGHVVVQGAMRHHEATILRAKAKGIEVPILLVDIPALYGRPGNPYLSPDGHDWWDNGERFAVFSRVVTEVAMNRAGLRWQPTIVHAHDWQTGLVPALLTLEESPPKSIFTIHNMAYQGNFPRSLFDMLVLPQHWWHPEAIEFYGNMSMLKAGIMMADWVTTVSPTYAKEICYPEFAFGFEGINQKRADEGRLTGILNGIDTEEWNPKKDPYLVKHYSVERGRTAGKRANKTALLEMLGLPYELAEEVESVVGFVGRLVDQKGVDLILEVLPEWVVETNACFVIVGSGDPHYEMQLREMSERYPNRVLTYIGYSEGLAHMVEAGADLFLMPSRFEPCGLNQMYSLVYGTPPIVHHTGGLADTVVNATDENVKAGTATGFVFYDMSRHALKSTLLHALYTQQRPRRWQKLQKTGMQQDFSWDKSAECYSEIYQQAHTTESNKG